MEMLSLTGTPAMATLVYTKPECERKREGHRRPSHVFLLLSHHQHLGWKPRSAKHRAWVHGVSKATLSVDLTLPTPGYSRWLLADMVVSRSLALCTYPPPKRLTGLSWALITGLSPMLTASGGGCTSAACPQPSPGPCTQETFAKWIHPAFMSEYILSRVEKYSMISLTCGSLKKKKKILIYKTKID